MALGHFRREIAIGTPARPVPVCLPYGCNKDEILDFGRGKNEETGLLYQRCDTRKITETIAVRTAHRHALGICQIVQVFHFIIVQVRCTIRSRVKGCVSRKEEVILNEEMDRQATDQDAENEPDGARIAPTRGVNRSGHVSPLAGRAR